MSPTSEDLLLLELESALAESVDEGGGGVDAIHGVVGENMDSLGSISTSGNQKKRIAFLYDSTLTAFLMMGNLSPVSFIIFYNFDSSEGESVVWVEPMLCVLGDPTFLGKHPYC